MRDEDRTKAELISELVVLRERISELERSETQRKRLEETLRRWEERYGELVENGNDIIYTRDLEGNFTWANPAATRIYGYTREEMLRPNIVQIVDPEYLPLARQKIREKLEGSPRTEPYELLTYSKEGELIWVEVSTRLLEREGQPVGVQGIARDITERKRVEEELGRRSDELAALYDVSLDVAGQLDLDTLLKTIVLRAMELLRGNAGGLSLYDPGGQDLELTVHQGLSKDYTGTRLALGEGACGKVAQSGEPLVVKDYANWGGRSPHFADEPTFNVLAVPIKRGDTLLGALYLRDPDLERRFEEGDIRLATLFANQAAIATENARLYQGARKKIDELSSLLMSHELRGPLTNIKIAAQTWDSLISDGDVLQRELLNIVQQESDRLTWIVERILSIALLEAGLATPEWQELSLRSLIAKAVDASWLPQHDHRLEVVVESELRVGADEGWTVMAIRNLLENAIKYCPPGSHIEVRASKIDEQWAKVTVADNGKGIDAQELRRIFEKFYRGENAIDRGVTGHGLGLYLVRLLVQAQGGTVWASSEEGKGASFGFSLPLAH